jgi:hypothetical protein
LRIEERCTERARAGGGDVLNSTLAKPAKPEKEKSSTWSSEYETPTAHEPPGHGLPENSVTPLAARVWVSPSRVTLTPPST